MNCDHTLLALYMTYSIKKCNSMLRCCMTVSRENFSRWPPVSWFLVQICPFLIYTSQFCFLQVNFDYKLLCCIEQCNVNKTWEQWPQIISALREAVMNLVKSNMCTLPVKCRSLYTFGFVFYTAITKCLELQTFHWE